MSKKIELLKKLKALADRGIGGEKQTAMDMLEAALIKHGLTMSDLEEEIESDYYFVCDDTEARLLVQIASHVRYDIKCYNPTKKVVKQYKLPGNIIIKCTLAEYIQISQTFDIMMPHYKQELNIFYKAFIKANGLLATPPKEKMKYYNNLTPEELEQQMRSDQMAKNIHKKAIQKQIKNYNQ